MLLWICVENSVELFHNVDDNRARFFQNEIIVESLANVKIYSGRLLWKSC